MRRLLPLIFVLPAPAFALGELLPTPAGSVRFGTEVVYLPNGNFVVTDPAWTDGALASLGAVYLYSSTGELISRLTGSSVDDGVGTDGIVVLANGNFVVRSSYWDAPGGLTDAGAVTWGNADSGFGSSETTVSDSNSLVGTHELDRVGEQPVVPLVNGHYVVPVPDWGEGALMNAGAATWGNGDVGTSGQVGNANSLVGTHANDNVGKHVTALTNGNYVVTSPNWDSDLLENVGAVTLRPGNDALPIPVSTANSMVGASSADRVGSGGTIALATKIAFASPQWDNGAALDTGAVTCVDGGTTTSGVVDIDNSFVGSAKLDSVGSGGLIALLEDGFAFASPDWDRGVTVNAGAVTRGSCMDGVSGFVGDNNSKVGGSANDRVGSGGITALPNGNFVAVSPEWDDPVKPDVGAVRWMRADGGSVGILTGDTSLRGNFAGDLAFARVIVLANGNYVVTSHVAQNWEAVQAGAVTWCPSDKICSKVIGTSRSLMGANDGDRVGSAGVFALKDGNYVVASPFVDSVQHADSGAVTWGDGATGSVGIVDATNSLIGRAAGDQIGAFGVFALADGRYLALSPLWDGLDVDAGAITLAPAGGPSPGIVDESNSLTGASASDNFGWHRGARNGGNGRAIFSFWRTGQGAGAVAVLDSNAPAIGPVNLGDAIVGAVPSQGGVQMRFDYHETTQTLLVGDPLANRVWLASLGSTQLPDAILHDGFED